jgi:hypothetical protein
VFLGRLFWMKRAEPMTTNSDFGVAPRSRPRTSPLLTHDEVVLFLRNRGFTSVADEMECGRVGPPFVTWNGEQRFNWLDAYQWGDWRDYWRPWSSRYSSAGARAD